jgi:DNA-binding transcriptional ArsR family regulator
VLQGGSTAAAEVHQDVQRGMDALQVDQGASSNPNAEPSNPQEPSRSNGNSLSPAQVTDVSTLAVERAQRMVQRAADQLPMDAVLDAADGARNAADGLPGALAGHDASASDDAGPVAAPQQVAPESQSILAQPMAQGIMVATVAGAAAIALWFAAGTSSSVGAASAGAASGSKALAKDLRRLLPYASPLFTRFERDTVLGHPRREALYAIILQNPGVSLQALGDATGLSRTATLHHLRLMEKQHLIVSRRMGRSRHFFENGGRFGRDQKAAYAVLQNDRSRQVALFVDAHPGVHQKDLCEALGLAPSIAHWHVRRLQEAQLIECRRDGRNVTYLPGPGLGEVARTVTAPTPSMPPEPAAEPILAPVVVPQAA